MVHGSFDGINGIKRDLVFARLRCPQRL